MLRRSKYEEEKFPSLEKMPQVEEKWPNPCNLMHYLFGQNFGGQNFRHQVEISAVLSDEIFYRLLISPYNSQEKYVLT